MPVLHAFDQLLCEDPSCSDDPGQETFFRGCVNRDLFRLEPSMDAWLCNILRNQFHVTTRKRIREVEDAGGEYAGQMAERPSQEEVVALRDL